MLNKICVTISDRLCKKNGVWDINDHEITAYGLEILISTTLSISVVIVLGIISRRFTEIVWFLISFMTLRGYSGGYHAETHFRCFLILLSCVIVGYVLLQNIPDIISKPLSICMLLVSEIVVYFMAPIVDKNRPMSNREIDKNRNKCKIILLFIMLTAVVFLIIGKTEILFSISYGTIVTGSSVIAAKIKNKNLKGGRLL